MPFDLLVSSYSMYLYCIMGLNIVYIQIHIYIYSYSPIANTWNVQILELSVNFTLRKTVMSKSL
jgi:uncharacterized protein with PQ loop repeat